MFLSFLFKDDHNNGLVKDHFEEKEKGKSAVGKIELQDGSKLKEWESCWKKNMEPLAERTLSASTAEVKKAYKLIQHAYGLPLVEVAFEKVKQFRAQQQRRPMPLPEKKLRKRQSKKRFINFKLH